MRWWVAFVVLVAAVGGARAEERPAPVRVGVVITPPFVMAEGGQYSGLAVDLWHRVEQRLGRPSVWKTYELPGLLEALEAGHVDVAVAPLTVTAERAELFDFTLPFHGASLSAAVAARPESAIMSLVDAFLSSRFLAAVGGLAALLALVGLGVWLFERRRNPQFGGRGLEGIGSAFWWSAVTMTTVGYGDKAPVTLGGRLVGLVWMFAALIVISGFTGAVASALTVQDLHPTLRSFHDVARPGLRVGAMADSNAVDFLLRRHVSVIQVADQPTGLAMVRNHQLDAFVGDRPVLKYLVRQTHPGDVVVLPDHFDPGFYAFGLPGNSSLRKPINLAILQETGTREWAELVARYLGPPG